jgi:phage tail-like protein
MTFAAGVSIPAPPSPPSMPSVPAPPSIPKPPAPPAPPKPPGMPGIPGVGKKSKTAAEQVKDPATTVLFHLEVDNLSAGWWNSFEGLGMETAIEQREEGGNNIWVHQLPTRLKFSNIKLSRPLNEDSQKVAVWFMQFLTKLDRKNTACIKAVATAGKNAKVIAEWNLRGVVPVRWTGPSFSVDSPKLAVETLEIAHHGFMEPVAKGGM